MSRAVSSLLSEFVAEDRQFQRVAARVEATMLRIQGRLTASLQVIAASFSNLGGMMHVAAGQMRAFSAAARVADRSGAAAARSTKKSASVVPAAAGAGAGAAATGRPIRGAAADADNLASTLLRVSGIGAALGGILAAIGSVGKGFRMAVEFEQAEVAMTTLLGSAGKAKVVLADLTNFAAKTPFEMPELTAAAKSLLAFGVTADDLMPTIKSIGDISSGVGASINELAQIFGKAKVQGRLFAEDINQLTGRGIPVIAEFAKQFGVAESEIRGLVENGKVGFDQLQKAFVALTAQGGKFHGMMAAQSQTLQGLFSTLKDAAGIKLRGFAEAVIDATNLKNVMKGVTAALESFGDSWKSVRKWALGVGAAVTAIVAYRTALMTIVIAQNAVAKAQAVVLALSGPAGWKSLAVGAALAAGAVIGVDAAFRKMEASARKAGAAAADAIKATKKPPTWFAAFGDDRGKTKAVAKDPVLEPTAFGEAADKAMESRAERANALFTETRTAAEKYHITLTQLNNDVKDGAMSFDAYARGLAAARKEFEENDEATKKAKDLAEDVETLTDKLRNQVYAFGLTGAAADVYALSQRGASEATLKTAQTLADELQRLEAWKDGAEKAAKATEDMFKKMESDAEEVIKDVMTPLEKYEEQIAKLEQLRFADYIKDDVFDLAVTKAQKELNKPLEGGISSLGEMHNVIQKAVISDPSKDRQTALLEKQTRHLQLIAENTKPRPQPIVQ
jgi:tape measure domain-containing protein